MSRKSSRGGNVEVKIPEEEHKPDHIYLNMDLVNNNKDIDTKIEINRTFQMPIIDRPDNYEISVIRFLIPAFNIPLIYDWNNFTRTISFNYTQNLPFGPQYTNTFVQTVDVIPDTPTTATRGNIYFISQIVRMINVTFVSLKAQTDADASVLTKLTFAPFCTYDPVTQLFSFTFEKNKFYPDVSNATLQGIYRCYFDEHVFTLFNSLYVDFNSYNDAQGLDDLVLVFDKKNNSTTVGVTPAFVMTQDLPTLGSINELERIIVTTTVASRFEFTGDTYIISDNSVVSAQSNFQAPILTDFVIDKSARISYDTYYQYLPTAEYRMSDLKGSAPIYNITLSAFYKDINGVIRPILIKPGVSASFKIMIRRKRTPD